MALFLDVGPDDVLRIGDSFITVERKSGARARLKIIGPEQAELLKKGREVVTPPLRVPVSQTTGD